MSRNNNVFSIYFLFCSLFGWSRMVIYCSQFQLKFKFFHEEASHRVRNWLEVLVWVVSASFKLKVFDQWRHRQHHLCLDYSFHFVGIFFCCSAHLTCEWVRVKWSKSLSTETWLRMFLTSMPRRKANCEITVISKWIQHKINQTLLVDCFSLQLCRQRRINCWVHSADYI